jgi:hypothetical protein
LNPPLYVFLVTTGRKPERKYAMNMAKSILEFQGLSFAVFPLQHIGSSPRAVAPQAAVARRNAAASEP